MSTWRYRAKITYYGGSKKTDKELLLWEFSEAKRSQLFDCRRDLFQKAFPIRRQARTLHSYQKKYSHVKKWSGITPDSHKNKHMEAARDPIVFALLQSLKVSRNFANVSE